LKVDRNLKGGRELLVLDGPPPGSVRLLLLLLPLLLSRSDSAVAAGDPGSEVGLGLLLLLVAVVMVGTLCPLLGLCVALPPPPVLLGPNTSSPCE
jgi:hypothetical protein